MLEIIDVVGKGFTVLKDYNSWRVAQLGYDKDVNSVEGISLFGRHHETDEVFVLINGTAYMATRGFEDDPSALKIQKLEKNKLFVVKQNQWHAALLESGSNLLIIENQDTGELNSENYKLTSKEKEEIINRISTLND